MGNATFDPLKTGLWPAMVGRNGALNVPAWHKAAETGDVVGNCRQCNGWLTVDEPADHGETNPLWYMAKCLTCGHEIASPGGRILRRSGRISERPNGGR